MINILWVEDDENVVKRKKTYFECQEDTIHIKNDFTDAIDFIENEIDNFDLAVLDINLKESSKDTPRVKEISAQFDLNEGEFLKESGMYLFIHLLEKGFPRERTVFLTANCNTGKNISHNIRKAFGEADENGLNSLINELTNNVSEEKGKEIDSLVNNGVNENNIDKLCEHADSINDSADNIYESFKKSFKRARIIPPEAIHKDKYDRINGWVNDNKPDYLVLRRGVIEGCTFFLKKLKEENDKDIININNFIPKKQHMSKDDIINYLSILQSQLPLTEPSEEDKKNRYILFIRTLSYEWVSANPADTVFKNNKNISDYLFLIMKTTRNWAAHNSNEVFASLSEKDVAYLFICNMRAMFKLDNKVECYEKILFSLFTKSPDSSGYNCKIVESYTSLCKRSKTSLCERSKTIKKSAFEMFNDLLGKGYIKKPGENFFLIALYQLFWFNTSKITNNHIFKKNGKEHPYSIERQFDYSSSNFVAEFSSRIFKNSFDD